MATEIGRFDRIRSTRRHHRRCRRRDVVRNKLLPAGVTGYPVPGEGRSSNLHPRAFPFRSDRNPVSLSPKHRLMRRTHSARRPHPVRSGRIVPAPCARSSSHHLRTNLEARRSRSGQEHPATDLRVLGQGFGSEAPPRHLIHPVSSHPLAPRIVQPGLPHYPSRIYTLNDPITNETLPSVIFSSITSSTRHPSRNPISFSKQLLLVTSHDTKSKRNLHPQHIPSSHAPYRLSASFGARSLDSILRTPSTHPKSQSLTGACGTTPRDFSRFLGGFCPVSLAQQFVQWLAWVIPRAILRFGR
jgi:hypothetical protein